MTAAGRRGFSLSELIIAIALMSIVMIPIALMLLEYSRVVVEGDSITRVISLVNRRMAEVRCMQNDGSLSPGITRSSDYGGFGYDLETRVDSLYKSYIYPVELSVCPGEGSFSTGAVYRVLTYGTNQAHLYGAGSSGEGAGGLQSDYLNVSGGIKGSVGIYYVILKNTRKPNLVIKGVKIYCPAPPYQSLNYISVNLIDRTARNMNLELTGSPQYVEFKPYFYVQSDPIYPYQDGRGAIFSFGRTMYRYTVAISYVFVDGSESPYTIYDFSYP